MIIKPAAKEANKNNQILDLSANKIAVDLTPSSASSSLSWCA